MHENQQQLFRVSYFDKEIDRQIKELSGPRFGLIERFKMKGIGSQRFIVMGVNTELSDLWKEQTATQFTNIELRKNGLLLHFRFKIENYVLVFPYSTLNIYKNGGNLTLISGKWTIRLSPANNMKLKLAFVSKLMELKIKFLPPEQKEDYYGMTQ